MLDIFEFLSDPEIWRWLQMEYPRGCAWKHVGIAATRKIVGAIQNCLDNAGVAIWVTLDETDVPDSAPVAIILLCGKQTKLIPLKFREKIVCVGKEPVATFHDSGVVLLAMSICAALDDACREATHKKKSKRSARIAR